MTSYGYPSYRAQVADTVEELPETETILDIYNRLSSIIGSNGRFTYFCNGVDDTAGLKALVARGVASGVTANMTMFGKAALWMRPGLEINPAGLQPGSSITFDGGIERRWDPKINGPYGGPDATLGGLFTGTGDENNPCAPGLRIVIRNGTHDYNPKISWQGKVLSTDGTTIIVQPDPGFAPEFDTMDVFHGLVGGLWKYSKSEARGSGTGTSYPCVMQPNGTLVLSPPQVTGNITGVTNYNPLEFAVTAAADGQMVLINGVVGLLTVPGGVSLVNGVAGLSLQVDEDFPGRAVVMKDGAPIDASLATAYVSGGSIAIQRVPDWVVPGMTLVGAVRKRGSAEIDPRFFKDWYFEGTIAAAQGVLFKGRYGSGTLECRIKTRPAGYMSGTAGCVITSEFKGKIIAEIEGYGYGDDKLNAGSFKWGQFLSSIGANQLVVDASKVYPPTVGDMISFEKGTTRVVNPITAVSFAPPDPITGVRLATVTVATPGGVDATWLIQNQATCPEMVVPSFSLGGGARGLLTQSDFWRVGDGTAEDIRGALIRHQNPNSAAHPNQGCAKGGGSVGIIKGKNCAVDYIDKANGVYVYRMIGATAAVPGVTPVQHGPAIQDGYGFNFALTEGVPLYWPQVTLSNPGTERANHPRTVADPNNPGNFDFVAIGVGGVIEIAQLNVEALLWAKALLLNGGNVIIGNRGRGILPMVDADISVNYLAYGAVEATGAITTTRRVTLLPAFAQSGDPVVIRHNGTGSSIQPWDAASNTAIGPAITPNSRFQGRFRNGNWIMF